jgi:hypothetical protein
MGHDWQWPHDRMSNKGLHSLQKHWKMDCEKTDMLGENRHIWCAQNLCVYVQLAECSAETHPSHGKTIWRISEENAYKLLTKMSMLSSKCLHNVCACVHIYPQFKRTCIRTCMHLYRDRIFSTFYNLSKTAFYNHYRVILESSQLTSNTQPKTGCLWPTDLLMYTRTAS